MAFSAANKKFIFPAYMYALGTGQITGFGDNNISLSFITKPVPSAFDMNSIYFKYYNFNSLEEGTIQDSLMYLTNVVDKSVNADTEKSASNTYEGMRQTPVEYYLFTKGYANKLKECPLTADYDYNVNALKNKRLANYFRTEYDLHARWDPQYEEVVGPYSQQKYQELGIKEEICTESMPFKTADAFEFQDRDDLIEKRLRLYKKGQKGNAGINLSYDGHCLGYGSLGFILSYTDDKHKDDERIPMAYYEFAGPIFSNCDYIKINWNENGFIEAK